MVEFALVLPVLMLLVLGIIKFGIVFNNYLTVNDAVRAGARQFALGRGSADACAPAASRVRSSSTNLPNYNDPAQLVVTPNPAPQPGSTNTCSNLTLGTDVKLTATYPCNITILPFIPTITMNCSASTTERVE